MVYLYDKVITVMKTFGMIEVNINLLFFSIDIIENGYIKNINEIWTTLLVSFVKKINPL